MPRQDIDPLADTQPSRYAYESDDEDETGLAFVSGAASVTPSAEFTFLPPVKDGKDSVDVGGSLVIASGAIGIAWARGANLGEQIGQVNIDKRSIGLVFRPTWVGSKDAVVISEAFTRLPIWSMSPYAAAILERWKPSRVILLDAYSSATYISPTPIPHHEAPLRYLSTELKPPSFSIPLSLFAPPNLLQSTTAAFLNLLSLPETFHKGQKTPGGLAILVPSSRAPLPNPRSLHRNEDEDESEDQPSVQLSALFGLDDSENWDALLLREAHRAILQAVGIGSLAEEWDDHKVVKGRRPSTRSAGRRKLTEAEEGMYI